MSINNVNDVRRRWSHGFRLESSFGRSASGNVKCKYCKEAVTYVLLNTHPPSVAWVIYKSSDGVRQISLCLQWFHKCIIQLTWSKWSIYLFCDGSQNTEFTDCWTHFVIAFSTSVQIFLKHSPQSTAWACPNPICFKSHCVNSFLTITVSAQDRQQSLKHWCHSFTVKCSVKAS